MVQCVYSCVVSCLSPNFLIFWSEFVTAHSGCSSRTWHVIYSIRKPWSILLCVHLLGGWRNAAGRKWQRREKNIVASLLLWERECLVHSRVTFHSITLFLVTETIETHSSRTLRYSELPVQLKTESIRLLARCSLFQREISSEDTRVRGSDILWRGRQNRDKWLWEEEGDFGTVSSLWLRGISSQA